MANKEKSQIGETDVPLPPTLASCLYAPVITGDDLLPYLHRRFLFYI